MGITKKSKTTIQLFSQEKVSRYIYNKKIVIKISKHNRNTLLTYETKKEYLSEFPWFVMSISIFTNYLKTLLNDFQCIKNDDTITYLVRAYVTSGENILICTHFKHRLDYIIYALCKGKSHAIKPDA